MKKHSTQLKRRWRSVATWSPVHSDAFRTELGSSLLNLSSYLSSLGRREEALAASEEAAKIGRDLAAANPDAFRRRI